MTMGKIFELAFLGTHCHWMLVLASYLILVDVTEGWSCDD